MFEYPLTNISKQQWHKKVEATLMFSIPAEDEALPVLYEILDVLQHLNEKGLQQVFGEDVREYFFNEVFPQVCSKIIKSRYFKNQIVLTLSNKILANCLNLYARYFDLVEKYRGLNQILATVLASDQYYFKTNNQLDYKLYPHYYFENISNYTFTSTLNQDDFVDIIKSNGKYDKLVWSRGKVLCVNESYLEVEYLNDVNERSITVDRHSFQIALYKSKSHDFEWRMSLKEGDLLDCQDSFGGWYHGTVVKVYNHDNGSKSVRITYKVYDENGNKNDQNGKFYGFTDQEETFDVTVPKIMLFCSTCKYRNYEVAKSSFQTDDSNDMVFQEIDGEKVYALPRKRALSEFYFKELNTFGKMGGFDKPIEKMLKDINFEFLCSYVKAIGNVCTYLHKQVVIQLVEKIKTAVEKHLFAHSDIVTKQFTKQRSESLFSGLKNLMKRLYSPDDVQQYENSLKMKLVSQCLESQSLKRKLQGLHQLKDIVRGISHISERAKTVKNWIIQEKIFDKIYLQNSHVQLIKKSEDFFKFLINEDILQVKDLERLYKIAQKGDYESRVSLYKLFQEMSHVFNKSHVDFLIDTILESDLNLVLNEDIDMLHELSRFSNYFPKQKVKDFFERLILNDTKNKELNDYAIKKYSQIVARGYQMKAHRKEIIKNFVSKLNTNDYEKVIKVLKGIFDGINVGDWGKKDLCDILEQERIEEIIVKAIKQHKQKPDYKKIVNEMLNFQLFLIKLTIKIKVNLQTLRTIWQELKHDPTKKMDYYHWLNQIMECQQGIQVSEEQDSNNESSDLVEFFKQLFSHEALTNLTNEEFTLARNLFVEINKKSKMLTVSNVIKEKEIEKEYKRRMDMKSLKLLEEIETIIFQCSNKEISQKAFQFYLGLYSSKQNSTEEISSFLDTLINKLKAVYESKEFQKIERTLNMIEMVVNDSEKYQQLDIVSMIKCRKASYMSVTIINDVSYMGDSIRKETFYEKRNVSLLQLKLKIAAKVNLNFDEIKLVGKIELSDYYNSYTLSELNINSDDPLTVSRKSVQSIPQEDLIIDGKLNPKAIRVFKTIYEKYATHQNQMSMEDYNKFTAMCLGTFSKSYFDKIQPIYNKYDSNHDGLLSIEDFLTFYTDAALDKPQTVWSNLKNLHVRGNFKFKDEPEEILSRDDLPRYKLYNNEEFYDILFSLLEEKTISKTVYNFLLRLPANKTIHQEIMNIWNDDYDSSGKQNLKKFLTQKSKFRFMYKLILILNIFELNESNCSMWKVKFAIRRGYEIPFEFLRQIADTSDSYSSIDLDIIELIYEIIKEYVFSAFGSKEAMESASLFEEDCTMDEKMECLLTGVYPKQYSSVRKEYSTSYVYEWETTKPVFTKLFLEMLNKMKQQIAEEKDQQKKTVLSSMVFKLMVMLSCLLVNEGQSKLLPLYRLFFDEKESSKELNQFYTLILCICFYSRPDQQHLHIHELFKYIKSKHITSEHFRVLALLVSKFGFKEENLTEIPQVLLKNILEEENQPTIEGCAKLLCNFDVGQLSSITPKDVEMIFDKCLFGDNITCKKEPARNQIYELLIKISEANKEIAQQVVQKTKAVILQNMPLMKVAYSTEVNKRCSYGYAGLKNLGNICYMNSMLQQLYINKTFRYLLLRANDRKEPEWTFDAKGEHVDDNFLHQIQRIFAYLQTTTRQQFSPSAFCIAYKPFGESVNIMMQQDVQQFVSMFFDRLQEGIKEHPLRNLVQNFYTGKTANLFKCHNCKKAKKIEQNFHSVSLQVKNSKNLSESFNRYALGEVINDYKCDFCQQKVDVSKMSRISKLPQVLIIHLQRIVFNLDTFINQKITSRHQFPMALNIYPYTLQHFDREQSSQQHPSDLTEYDYELTGIVIHIGNAESGHYISYIKTEDNRWLQFNDSLISLFSVNSIEAECFGGMLSSFEDDFEWEKKEQSKSAYILIYNRKIDPNLQLILRQEQLAKKNQILDLLKVQIQQQKQETYDTSTQKLSEPTESQQQTGSAFQDSQKEREKQKYREEEDIKEIEMIKKKKSDDDVHGCTEDRVVQKDNNNSKNDTVTLKIKNAITPYVDEDLRKEIEVDNRVHFFQTSLASEGFSTFFAKLISIPHLHSEELIKMCQKLTFSFWLKSKSFRQLLLAFEAYLKTHPESVYELVLKNDQFFSLLIENSNIDIRVNVAHFLANAIESYASCGQKDGEYLSEESQQGRNIYKFLDRMFELIPTTVTKCWTKFNQYFEFWFFISEKKMFAKYLVNTQVLKHFVDYFLDKKSPLKIYTNKKVQEIGSSYANPDFSMLLRCVSTLLNYYFDEKNGFNLTEDDEKVLIYFEFIEKLISEGYQEIAAKMAKQVCPQNVKASQKFAVVLLKGFSKSTYENIQRYIEVLKEYVAIEDEYQTTRMQWVLGKQTLNVSTITKTLNALSAKNFDERLYSFDTSLYIEQGASFLQPIFQLNRRVQNFCILCVQGILQICLKSKPVRTYLFNLGAPSLLYARYLDFYEEFINRYIDQSKRSYYSTVTSFNKTELGEEVKELYKKVMELKKVEWHEDESDNQEQNVQQTAEKDQSDQKAYIRQNKQSEEEKPSVIQDNYITVDENFLLPMVDYQLPSDQQSAEMQFIDGSFSKDKDISNQSHPQDEIEMINLVEISRSNSEQVPPLLNTLSSQDKSQKNQQNLSTEVPLPQHQSSKNPLTSGPFLNKGVLPQLQKRPQNQPVMQHNTFPGLSQPIVEWQQINTEDVEQSHLKQMKQPHVVQYDPNDQPQIEEEKVNDAPQYDWYENLCDFLNVNLDKPTNDPTVNPTVNPYYIMNDNDSNKNNSRKSQVEGNDSRDEDFNGIQLRQIHHIINEDGKQDHDANWEVQDHEMHQQEGLLHGQDNFQNQQFDIQHRQQPEEPTHDNQPQREILNHLNDTDNKSSEDWSHESREEPDPHSLPPAHAGAVRSSRRRQNNKAGLKIQSKKAIPSDEAGYHPEGDDDDENEPFIKSKKPCTEKQQEMSASRDRKSKSQLENDYQTIRTPVQFIYTPIESLQLSKQLSGIEAIYHESRLITIKTKPTGITNFSFTRVEGSRKLYNRIKEEAWVTKKQEIVKGHFITNHSRLHLRVITQNGSQLIKPNESGWIWSDLVIKMEKCERCSDWPEWSLFE